jgi:hypothetical protein
MYFWIYLHLEVVVIVVVVAALLLEAPPTFGVHGSDDVEGVLLSSPKSMSWVCLANSFSSEVLSWFNNVSSSETSSASSSSSAFSYSSDSSSGESEESSSPPSSSKGHSLFLAIEDSTSSSNLHLSSSFDAILWRRERERE